MGGTVISFNYPRHLAVWTYFASCISWFIQCGWGQNKSTKSAAQYIFGDRVCKSMVWSTTAVTALLLSFDNRLSVRESLLADEILFLVVIPLLTLSILCRNSAAPYRSIRKLNALQFALAGTVPLGTLMLYFLAQRRSNKNGAQHTYGTSARPLRITLLFMILFYIYL